MFGRKIPLKQRLQERQEREAELKIRIAELSERTGVQVSILSNAERTLKLLQIVAEDPVIKSRIAELQASGIRVFSVIRVGRGGAGIIGDDGKSVLLREGSSRRALRRFLE